MKFNVKQYQRFVFVTWIIQRDYNDELSEFEEDFIKTARKEIGRLSEKQVRVLEKIVSRFFRLD